MARPRLYQTPEEHTRARAARNQRYYALKKERQIFPPLPPGPYRVLYADPPWKYGSTDPFFHGHAKHHYPPLSIAEICALPVKRLVGKSAVLFLWVTSPILPECFPVLKAWGFTYKASLVWDKTVPIYGYYVGTQHEFLLVSTRGSCKPDIQALPPSLHRIPRDTKHSAKPAEMRMLIDALYPEGRRLELFARTRAEGWDAWGNEVALASTPSEPLSTRKVHPRST